MCNRFNEMVEHPIEECQAREKHRQILQNSLGIDLSLPMIVRVRLLSSEKWQVKQDYCKVVKLLKWEDESENEEARAEDTRRRSDEIRKRRGIDTLTQWEKKKEKEEVIRISHRSKHMNNQVEGQIGGICSSCNVLALDNMCGIAVCCLSGEKLTGKNCHEENGRSNAEGKLKNVSMSSIRCYEKQ